jgi:hypothetical protein
MKSSTLARHDRVDAVALGRNHAHPLPSTSSACPRLRRPIQPARALGTAAWVAARSSPRARSPRRCLAPPSGRSPRRARPCAASTCAAAADPRASRAPGQHAPTSQRWSFGTTSALIRQLTVPCWPAQTRTAVHAWRVPKTPAASPSRSPIFLPQALHLLRAERSSSSRPRAPNRCSACRESTNRKARRENRGVDTNSLTREPTHNPHVTGREEQPDEGDYADRADGETMATWTPNHTPFTAPSRSRTRARRAVPALRVTRSRCPTRSAGQPIAGSALCRYSGGCAGRELVLFELRRDRRAAVRDVYRHALPRQRLLSGRWSGRCKLRPSLRCSRAFARGPNDRTTLSRDSRRCWNNR